MRAHRDVVLHLRQEVQLLHGDLIDLVDGVYARDVNPRPLDHVDELLVRAVLVQLHVRVLDLVLAQDVLHRFLVEEGRLAVVVRRERYPALVLLSKRDLRGLSVEADAEALELVLD